MDKLSQGYQRFKEKFKDDPLLEELASGQSPEVMVIACCDSRVDPAVLFQSTVGDLFIQRNVANFVPQYKANGHYCDTSTALEYAVCYLKVKKILIIGHSQCGGINARLNPSSLSHDDFISDWVAQIDVDGADANQAAKQALQQSYANCLSYPWIQSAVDAGDLSIELAFYQVETAELEFITT